MLENAAISKMAERAYVMTSDYRRGVSEIFGLLECY
jgi:hypothetical protein